MRPILPAILLAAAIGLAAGCDRSAPAQRPAAEPTPLEVAIAPVTVRSLPRTVEVTGTLFGQEEAVISSKLTGRIASIAADVGDEVSPGAILAQIDPTDYQLVLREKRAALEASLAKLGLTEIPAESFDPAELPAVRRAQAEAANAQARHDRARQLQEAQPPLISAQDYADIRTAAEVAARNAEVALLEARADLAAARTEAAAVATSEQRLADTAVRAPGQEGRPGLDYHIAERLVSPGEYVSEGRQMFRLVATDLIKFRADVPERFASSVRPGQPAAVYVEGDPRPAAGEVARVAPRIDPQSRMLRVEINIPNDGGALKPGAFARGSITTSTQESATFVPASAVVTFAGVHRVYSIKDGKAAEHRVQLGARDGDTVQIIVDPAPDHVITTNPAALAPGRPVHAPGA